MRYKDQIIDIQTGDIVLFRNEFIWYEPITWLSALVRLFTRCRYNHCAVVVSNWDVLFLTEAVAGGVITRPLEGHLERSKTKILIKRPRTGVHERSYCMKANSKVGVKYDFVSLLFFQLIYRLTGRWFGPVGNAAIEDGMVCSEYVAWCHDLPKWWLCSSRELYESNQFVTVFKE